MVARLQSVSSTQPSPAPHGGHDEPPQLRPVSSESCTVLEQWGLVGVGVGTSVGMGVGTGTGKAVGSGGATQSMPSIAQSSAIEAINPVPVPPSATEMYGHVAVAAHEPSSPRT